AGVVFGLALLAKPTMGLFTLAMLNTALVLAAGSDWLLTRPPLRRLLASVGLVWVIAIALAAPYYIANRVHIVGYVRENIFGRDKDLWAYQGTLAEQLGFYLWGMGGRSMLGRYLPLLVGLLLAGLISVLVTRRKELLVRTGAYVGITLTAWILITIIQVKYGFYGLTFFFLMVCAAILSLRLLVLAEWPRWNRLRWGIGVLLVCQGLWIAAGRQQHQVWNRASAARGEPLRKAYGDILTTLHANQREKHAVVFLTMQAPLNRHTLEWLERTRTGDCPFEFTGPGVWRDLALFRQAMETSDFIVAYKTLNPELNYPWERLAPETLSLARSLKNYVEIQSFAAPSGVVYYLFKKRLPERPGSAGEQVSRGNACRR